MTEEERNKRAYSMLRASLLGGACPRSINLAASISDCARSAVENLDKLGCFDPKYGELGSIEVIMTTGAIMRIGVGDSNGGVAAPTGDFIVKKVFEVVLDLDRRGLLNEDQRKASRAIPYAKEREAAAEKAREAAAEEERQRKAAAKKERAKKREAAERRIEEIKKIKGGK